MPEAHRVHRGQMARVRWSVWPPPLEALGDCVVAKFSGTSWRTYRLPAAFVATVYRRSADVADADAADTHPSAADANATASASAAKPSAELACGDDSKLVRAARWV